jgi:hypothetical protein
MILVAHCGTLYDSIPFAFTLACYGNTSTATVAPEHPQNTYSFVLLPDKTAPQEWIACHSKYNSWIDNMFNYQDINKKKKKKTSQIQRSNRKG